MLRVKRLEHRKPVKPLSPPQRLPLGIPIKISIIEKNRKRAGDDGKRETALFSLPPSHRAPRALFFFLPSLNTKASPPYKEASAEERGQATSQGKPLQIGYLLRFAETIFFSIRTDWFFLLVIKFSDFQKVLSAQT